MERLVDAFDQVVLQYVVWKYDMESGCLEPKSNHVWYKLSSARMSQGLYHMNFWLSVLKDTFSKVRMEELPMEVLPVEVFLPEPAVCFYMLSAYFQSLRSERQGGSHFFLYVSFLKPFGNPNGAALMSTLNYALIEHRYISASV